MITDHWARAVHRSKSGQSMSELGLVSRVTPVHTALRNCTRDEGRPFEFGSQVLISSHRKLLSEGRILAGQMRAHAAEISWQPRVLRGRLS
jgi:hypothetical protein